MTIETKATSEAVCSGEINAALHEFITTFEDFREANDTRLKELEAKTSADVLSEEKVERINRALDAQEAKLNRLTLDNRRPGRAVNEAPQASEHKTAFERYVRSGEAGSLQAAEIKSLSAGSDPDGGYVVPEQTERLITQTLQDISPIRQIASVRQIGANSLRKPISITGAAAGWVGETEARPETTSPTLAAVDFPTMELYAMPAATQTLLDDAVVDLEQWIADEVQTEFAVQEGAAFVNGDGNNKPRGFMDYPSVANGTEVWGQFGYLPTGVNGDFGTNPLDHLVDLIYATKQAYRARGRFVLNRSVLSQLRKFKDADGNYLWQPSVQAGVPSTLMGFPVTEAEDMPDIASGTRAIAFGDFDRGYLIVDRVGVRILRDPYSAKPYVLFYTTKRVGGGVQDFNALKFLKFSTS